MANRLEIVWKLAGPGLPSLAWKAHFISVTNSARVSMHMNEKALHIDVCIIMSCSCSVMTSLEGLRRNLMIVLTFDCNVSGKCTSLMKYDRFI